MAELSRDSGRPSAPTFGLADFDGNKRESFETFQSLMDDRPR